MLAQIFFLKKKSFANFSKPILVADAQIIVDVFVGLSNISNKSQRYIMFGRFVSINIRIMEQDNELKIFHARICKLQKLL
jgi:hypothetical protein